MNAAGDERHGLRLSKAPTRNNFVAKKKKKNHLETVFGTTLRRSANFYAKIDKVENYLETEYKFLKNPSFFLRLTFDRVHYFTHFSCFFINFFEKFWQQFRAGRRYQRFWGASALASTHNWPKSLGRYLGVSML